MACGDGGEVQGSATEMPTARQCSLCGPGVIARGFEEGPGGIDEGRILAMVVLTQRIRDQLNDHIRPLLERWFARAMKKSDVVSACATSAHLIILFKNTETMDATAVSTILSSQVRGAHTTLS